MSSIEFCLDVTIQFVRARIAVSIINDHVFALCGENIKDVVVEKNIHADLIYFFVICDRTNRSIRDEIDFDNLDSV